METKYEYDGFDIVIVEVQDGFKGNVFGLWTDTYKDAVDLLKDLTRLIDALHKEFYRKPFKPEQPSETKKPLREWMKDWGMI